MTNASQYKAERDEARRAVAFLVAEVASITSDLNHANQRACKYDAALRNATEKANEMETAARVANDTTAMTQNSLMHLRIMYDTTTAALKEEQKLREQAVRERDTYKSLYNTRSSYYDRLVQECEDLRTINAANRGPIWTLRLHALLQGEDVVTLTTLTDTIDKLGSDLAHTDAAAAQDKAYAVRTIDDLCANSERLRAELQGVTHQRDNLRARLASVIHRNSVQAAAINEERNYRRELGGQIVAALVERDRYKRLYFENVSGYDDNPSWPRPS